MEIDSEYKDIMMMASLGIEYFDTQLLYKIQQNPDLVHKRFYESSKDVED